MEKANKLKYHLECEKENFTDGLESERKKLIDLLKNATPAEIVNLNDFTSYTNVKRYAYEIEIINAKLRVINGMLGGN